MLQPLRIFVCTLALTSTACDSKSDAPAPGKADAAKSGGSATKDVAAKPTPPADKAGKAADPAGDEVPPADAKGDKPAGDKPSGDKPAGDKPAGDTDDAEAIPDPDQPEE